MKNVYLAAALLVAVLASCSKEIPSAEGNMAGPGAATKTVTVSAALTRTSLGEDRTRLVWTSGDAVGAFSDVASDSNVKAEFNDGSEAFAVEVAAGAKTLYAYYPYSADNAGKSAAEALVGIPSAQTQTKAGVLEGNNFPMTASGAITDLGDGSATAAVQFGGLGCAIALNIYGGNSAETVTAVSFTSDVASSGISAVDLTSGTAAYAANRTTTALSLGEAAQFSPSDAAPASSEDRRTFRNQVYLVLAKAVYPAGSTLVVSTTKGDYSFVLPSELDLSGADFMTMGLNLQKYTKVRRRFFLNDSVTSWQSDGFTWTRLAENRGNNASNITDSKLVCTWKALVGTELPLKGTYRFSYNSNDRGVPAIFAIQNDASNKYVDWAINYFLWAADNKNSYQCLLKVENGAIPLNATGKVSNVQGDHVMTLKIEDEGGYAKITWLFDDVRLTSAVADGTVVDGKTGPKIKYGHKLRFRVGCNGDGWPNCGKVIYDWWEHENN